MSEYYPEPKSLVIRVKAELCLSNYATKADLKDASGVDTSKCAKKVDLASLKSKVDKLNIVKLKNVPSNLGNLKSKVEKIDDGKLVSVSVDLSKLSDVAKNAVVKKYVYNAKIKNIEDKIPDITNLATTALNAKVNETKSKIPNISSLAILLLLLLLKIKKPNVSDLVKKLTITQKLVKLRIKLLLIMIMINLLLLKILIS